MSKLIVDSVQTTGGTAFNLPTADGAADATLKTDGAGNLSFASSGSSATFSKTFDLSGGAADYSNATNHIQWTDVDPSLSDPDKFVRVRMSGFLRATSNFRTRIMGLDASGSPITSGYLGHGYRDNYDGNNRTSSNGHNSNNGWIFFPGYTTAYGTNNNTYGNGMHFEYFGTVIRGSQASQTGHMHHIKYVYQQDTSYAYPNFGTIAWNNYSNDAAPATWYGVSIYSTSGSWDNTYTPKCRVLVEITTDGT